MTHSIGSNCQALVPLNPSKYKGDPMIGGTFWLLVLWHSPCGHLDGICLLRYNFWFLLWVGHDNMMPWRPPNRSPALSIPLAPLVHICVWVIDLSNLSNCLLEPMAEIHCQRHPWGFWYHSLLNSDKWYNPFKRLLIACYKAFMNI